MICKKDYNSYRAFGIQIVSVFLKKFIYLAALSHFIFYFGGLSLNCDSGPSMQLMGFSSCGTWA